MKAWLFAFLLASPYQGFSQSYPPNLKFIDGHPISYSNMHIVEEEGDFVGWDLRVTKLSDEYRVILFCGEGEPLGPVHATFRLRDGVAVVHPDNKECGNSVELSFQTRGVRIKVDDGDLEFVPQHENFIKEERWK